MSKLGYIDNIYGKQINIAIANTYSYNVLAGSNLPENSLIIASNVDEDNNDTGTYSLIATDSEGTPIRLTYSIQEGNGLYYSNDNDALSMHIDNETIVDSANGLKFNIESVLSDDFIADENNIYVNVDNIPTASKENYGIAAIDDVTIKSNDGILYVSTENLRYANNATDQYGIGIGDGKTTFVSNGYISASIESFDKASNTSFGLVKGDNSTIDIQDGVMRVNTDKLSFASTEDFGISKADNNTIIYDSSNTITVNENNLKTATANEYGVAKIDTESLDVKNGNISMKNYSYINNYIDANTTKLEEYLNKVKEFTDYISSGNLLYKGNAIHQFTINRANVVALDKPKNDEEMINMPVQTVSAVFDIITTCDFKLNIEFKAGTNVSEPVSINEVNYNDEVTYGKEEALNPNTVYKSTGGQKKKLTIKFKCKNYRNSVSSFEYTVTGVTFTVMNAKDALQFKSEKYSIIRYNSYYLTLVEKQKQEEIKAGNEYYILDLKKVYWS